MSKLSPEQVRAVRKRAGLTQAQFAEKLHVGIASVKRWELGTAVQHKAADMAIRHLDLELTHR